MKLAITRFIVLVMLVVAIRGSAAPENGSVPVLSAPPDIGAMAGSAEEQLKAAGYVQQEFFAEGTARSYVTRGEWKSDGVWGPSPGDTAPYTVRMCVRYQA